MILQSVPQECQQYIRRVFSTRSQHVRNPVRPHCPFNQAFLLHVPKTAREHPRCKPRIIPQDLTKPLKSEKSNISQNQQGPFRTQRLDTSSHGILLIQELGTHLHFSRFGPCQNGSVSFWTLAGILVSFGYFTSMSKGWYKQPSHRAMSL